MSIRIPDAYALQRLRAARDSVMDRKRRYDVDFLEAADEFRYARKLGAVEALLDSLLMEVSLWLFEETKEGMPINEPCCALPPGHDFECHDEHGVKL